LAGPLGPRPHPLISLLTLILVGGLSIATCNTDGSQYRFDNVWIKEYDAFMMVILPPPSDLQVDVQQLRGNRHVLVVRTNDSTPIADRTYYLPAPYSMVQLGADGDIYNVTMRISSRDRLQLYYGALTFHPTVNYPGQMYYRYGDAYFVTFSPVMNIPAGNVTLAILLRFTEREGDITGGLFPFLPSISLPPIVNIAIFVAITALVAYVESFFLLSSYFQHKASGLTNTRKAIALGSVVVAAVVVLWAFEAFVA